jgi:hypothetical protein
MTGEVLMHLRKLMVGRLALCGAAAAMLLSGAPVMAEAAKAADTPELLVVVPVTLDAHPQAAMLPNATACAVDIDDGQGEVQRVITVGEGETETLSCVDFVAAGPLPLPHSLGLIYDFESGPGSVFRGALILTQDSETGVWSMNGDQPDLVVNADIADLDSLRSALAAQ